MSMILNTTTPISNAENVQVTEVKLPEKVLGKEVQSMLDKVMGISVKSDSDYEVAIEMTRSVKELQRQVTDYWEPLRESTYKAYKTVTTKKKAMLDPLEKAESFLKEKVGGYLDLKEKQRREQERMMRLAAEQEMREKQKEAEKAIDAGNEVATEYAMAEAEVMENVAKAGMVESQNPKVDGVSVRKNWEIVSIDSSVVPTEFNGVEIRPVDKKLVMNLIKASKGRIQIPGVQYREKASISVKV